MMTFAVNYVGHPFNSSLVENRGLFNSLRISAAFLFVVATGVGLRAGREGGF